MLDTRAGLWLVVSSVVLTAAFVALFALFADEADVDFRGALEVAVTPGSVLLPVLGVLLVTSEWSQRTAMVTFALVPRRSRVLGAKLAAAVLLGVVLTALCVPVAALGTALAAPEGSDALSISPEFLGRVALSVVLGMLMGFAYGAVLLNSAGAIVAYFVLPLAFAALGALPPLHGIADWLSPATLAPLTSETMSGEEWAHAGTTLLVWLVAPLAAGLWRVSRADVR
jgi:hypothetical protein